MTDHNSLCLVCTKSEISELLLATCSLFCQSRSHIVTNGAVTVSFVATLQGNMATPEKRSSCKSFVHECIIVFNHNN